MDNVVRENKSKSFSLKAPVENKSIVNQIIERLTNAILIGELKPGAKLPTEVELSESMQAGRNSVREAIKALETMGLLVIRRAEGTFVSEGFSDRMMAPMLYGMVLEGGNSYALVELRKLFETGILQMAIEKANKQDIEDLHSAVGVMEALVLERATPEALQDADIAFHEILQEAVHNPLVGKFYTIIEKLSHPTRILAVEQFIEHGELKEMLELHYEIVRIVEEKDEASVKSAIDAHFHYWTINMAQMEEIL